jgi:hypothetical protein
VSSDDRFIAKELSKAELSAMATFAPAYFEYMASTISAGVSLLSCINWVAFIYKESAFHPSRQDLRVLPHQF